MPTVREAYLYGVEHLRAAGSAEPAIEAEVLLRHALRCDRTALYTRWERLIELERFSRYQELLEIRAGGRPVHYIIGEREFMSLSFAVDERVMIPRPETEILVEYLINALKERKSGIGHRASDQTSRGSFEARSPKPEARPLVMVDVGTGSGCIAVSLAYHLPQARVYATDISGPALQVAVQNAARHKVTDRITFLEGDLLTPLPDDLRGRVDVIAANPPYVPESEAVTLPREIREFEPAVAVFAAGQGTLIHARLVEQAPRWLSPGGLLAMEVGAGQAGAVGGLLRQDRRYDTIVTLPDLSGMQRVVAACRLWSTESAESIESSESQDRSQ